ncbi:MAG: hypothetical protein WCT40_00695 [Candidatus Magasanikbacteria bacterium]|jgi:hypothetical protein
MEGGPQPKRAPISKATFLSLHKGDLMVGLRHRYLVRSHPGFTTRSEYIGLCWVKVGTHNEATGETVWEEGAEGLAWDKERDCIVDVFADRGKEICVDLTPGVAEAWLFAA